ncbi:hypothetical protein DB830_23895 [Xanthomonas perforans]|nr:hypothetical protein DB830_23895 [Xanthomonas perforans]
MSSGASGAVQHALAQAAAASQLESPHERHPPDYPTLQSIGWPRPGPPQEPAWQAGFAAPPQALPARGGGEARPRFGGADTPGGRL